MTTYFPGILSTGALVPGLAAGTVRTTLGLGTADSPTFAGGTFTGQVVLPAGTVSLPSLQIGSFQTGFFEGTAGRLNLAVNGTQILEFRTNRVTIAGSAGLRFGSSTQLLVDTSNILAQRNATNPQISEVYKTYTSSTSNERLAFDTTAAGFLDIVAARGSLGGAENGIRIGGKLDGGSFVPWLSFASDGVATFAITGVARLTISKVAISCRHSLLPTVNNLDLGSTSAPWRDLFLSKDITFSPSASRTLATNLQFTFERVSNTEINLVYRGDDGTTRRLALPGFA